MYNIHAYQLALCHTFQRKRSHQKLGIVMRCYTKTLHLLNSTVFHNITFILLLSVYVVIALGFNCESLARDSVLSMS